MEEDEPRPRLNGPVEQSCVERQRDADLTVLQLVIEPIDESRMRQQGIDVGRECFGRDRAVQSFAPQAEQAWEDIRLGGVGVAVEGEDIFSSTTAEKVAIRDIRACHERGSAAERVGGQCDEEELTFLFRSPPERRAEVVSNAVVEYQGLSI